MTRVQFEKKGLSDDFRVEGTKRFTKKDADADGKVTFNEWLAAGK